MRHNNVATTYGLKKHWQRRVRTHFDAPAKKIRSQVLTQKRAAAIAPRPLGTLKPIVRCSGILHNYKVRAGRGFTLEELAGAGIKKNYARSVGIAVDLRRKNRSEESLKTNVDRLREYLSKLVVLPRKSDPSYADKQKELADAVKADAVASSFRIVNPAPVQEFTTITQEMRDFDAFQTTEDLRNAKRIRRAAKRAAKLAETAATVGGAKA